MNKEESWKRRIAEILSQRRRRVITRKGLAPSAVLVPIYKRGGEYYIVLTKRTQDVEHHKGQMAFPGGAYDDEDGNLETTALREAYEEVGIRPGDVEILGKLDDQATATSRFAITPFVGVIPYPYEFKVNREEVEALVEASVTALMDPSCFSTQTPDSEGRLHPWVHYQFGEHRITGITAIILDQFLNLVFGSGGLK
ncbi:MAG TPA: CoA pyrophosphatase [Dehalococcoidia bacterium]|nr:CoA pyrophosphatase [Dehalococcoidia bacterium]